MAQKRTAFILLLMMILTFISFVLSWMAYNQGGLSNGKAEGQKIAALEKKIEELGIVIQQFGVPATPQAPVTETPIPAQPEQPVPAGTGKIYTVIGDKVIMRMDGAAASGVVRILPKGVTLAFLNEQKTADGYTWVKVKDAEGKTGWVALPFVQ